MKKAGTVIAVFVFLWCGQNWAGAADPSYPTKPIEIIVGYAPGGGTDLSIRMAAEITNSKKYLKQQVIVSNKPGGGGRVAMAVVAKAKPDGYTLSGSTDSALIMGPHMEPVNYKPLEDFNFIIQLGKLDFAVAVLPDSPFRTFKEMVDYARANPDKLTIGTVGVGTANHVGLEAFFKVENLKVKLVPFAGISLTMNAFLGKHVMAASTATDFAGYAPQVKKEGKFRVLAVMSDERLPEYPQVPTFAELGYQYPLVIQSWYLISGPKDMDKSIANQLGEVLRKAMEAPEYIKLAKDLDIYTEKPIMGDALREGLVARNKKNEELFKRLKMGIYAK